MAQIMLASDYGLNFGSLFYSFVLLVTNKEIHGNHIRSTVKACTNMCTCASMDFHVQSSAIRIFMKDEGWNSFIVDSSTPCFNHSGERLRLFLKLLSLKGEDLKLSPLKCMWVKLNLSNLFLETDFNEDKGQRHAGPSVWKKMGICFYNDKQQW